MPTPWHRSTRASGPTTPCTAGVLSAMRVGPSLRCAVVRDSQTDACAVCPDVFASRAAGRVRRQQVSWARHLHFPRRLVLHGPFREQSNAWQRLLHRHAGAACALLALSAHARPAGASKSVRSVAALRVRVKMAPAALAVLAGRRVEGAVLQWLWTGPPRPRIGACEVSGFTLCVDGGPPGRPNPGGLGQRWHQAMRGSHARANRAGV
jgi:hypothetical protein